MAHPSDTDEEAGIVKEVCEEFNTIWSARLSIRFEYCDWYTHVVPGVDSDPQAVINQQIGSDYDIFIGIVWKHFGQVTPRAASGTAEEFEAAYAKYKADPRSVRLMVYFRTARVELNDIDLKQLEALRDFKSKLGPRGVLYSEYVEADQFKTLVRGHLQRIVQGWGSEWGGAVGVASPTPSPKSETTVADEGYLDLYVKTVQGMGASTEAINRIAQLMEKSGEASDRAMRDMTLIGSVPEPDRPAAVKDIFDGVAESLVEFSEGMEQEATKFSDSFSVAAEAFSRLSGYEEFTSGVSKGQGMQTAAVLKDLNAKIKDQVVSMENLRKSIVGLPRATTAFNRAKRNLRHMTRGSGGKSADGPWFPGMPTKGRTLTDEEEARYRAWRTERKAAGLHHDPDQFAEEQAKIESNALRDLHSGVYATHDGRPN